MHTMYIIMKCQSWDGNEGTDAVINFGAKMRNGKSLRLAATKVLDTGLQFSKPKCDYSYQSEIDFG